jgi:quinol monooxygenase YgiN
MDQEHRQMERLLLCRRHMVRLTVGLHATSTRRAHDLLEALRFLGLSARLESGCLGCFSWADPDSTVHYVEEWETEASMRQRVRSDRFTSLLAVVESAQDPHVQFDFVSQTRGLDFVEEARTDAAS